jgi:hypothetical protein
MGAMDSVQAFAHRGLGMPALPVNTGQVIEPRFWMEGRQYTWYGFPQTRNFAGALLF